MVIATSCAVFLYMVAIQRNIVYIVLIIKTIFFTGHYILCIVASIF